MDQRELGRLGLMGSSGFSIGGPADRSQIMMGDALATGESPTVRSPQNAVANAKLAQDPALRRLLSIQPVASCRAPTAGSERREGRPEPAGAAQQAGALSVTSADVLEALHRATGMPIVADYYTRLYAPSLASAANVPLFTALNRIADALRLRWQKDGEWLQLRSAGFYNDRLKEVPNRLLTRWAASRRERGGLTLEDLVEIAQLSDAQLGADPMAEGARACFGLEEWNLARGINLRRHLRFLAELTAAQRLETLGPTGLAFAGMTLAQQQKFIALGLGRQAERAGAGLEDLAGAALYVDYSMPGYFEWTVPEPPEGGARRRRAFRPPVREQSRAAALEAARRLDPQVSEAQIVPTALQMKLRYALGGSQGSRGMEITARPGSFSSGSFGPGMEEEREQRRAR
jgi:hypothetical protein